MSDSPMSHCAVLEYPDAEIATFVAAEMHLIEPSVLAADPVVPAVAEEEVKRRIEDACRATREEVERRMLEERDRDRREAELQRARTLAQFAAQRGDYFKRVECEVVHLALGIARKILQREADIDPTLVAALVRIALDRMESGTMVRLHVPPTEVEHWQQIGEAEDGARQWDVVGDSHLQPGDCVVETEVGKANFGFEAQLRDLESSFASLLSQRPTRA